MISECVVEIGYAMRSRRSVGARDLDRVVGVNRVIFFRVLICCGYFFSFL